MHQTSYCIQYILGTLAQAQCKILARPGSLPAGYAAMTMRHPRTNPTIEWITLDTSQPTWVSSALLTCNWRHAWQGGLDGPGLLNQKMSKVRPLMLLSLLSPPGPLGPPWPKACHVLWIYIRLEANTDSCDFRL